MFYGPRVWRGFLGMEGHGAVLRREMGQVDCSMGRCCSCLYAREGKRREKIDVDGQFASPELPPISTEWTRPRSL